VTRQSGQTGTASTLKGKTSRIVIRPKITRKKVGNVKRRGKGKLAADDRKTN